MLQSADRSTTVSVCPQPAVQILLKVVEILLKVLGPDIVTGSAASCHLQSIYLFTDLEQVFKF